MLFERVTFAWRGKSHQNRADRTRIFRKNYKGIGLTEILHSPSLMLGPVRVITPIKHGAAHSYECVLSMAEQGADLRGKSGLCRVSEVCKPELWVTRWFPKPSPKRDRAITKATVVSPLSPHCQPVLRAIRALCRANEIINS